MKLYKYGYPIIIWILTLLVIYTGIRPYEGGDGVLELWRTGDTIQYGWHIDHADHNNTSIVLNVITPFIAKSFNLKPIDVFRGILPFFYALTPVLLYFIFRRVISPGRAFLSAMFFIILPPSYQEIPNIAKSMIAEPLAVASLLILTNNTNQWVRGLSGNLTAVLSIVCHYTVGIFMLVWLGVSWLVTRSKVYLVVIVLLVSFSLIYFAFVGDGAIYKGIIHWDNNRNEQNDTVYKAITGGEFETYSMKADENELPSFLEYHPLRLPFNVSSGLMTLVIRMNVFVLFMGWLYWCRKYLKKHKELSAMIFISGIMVLLAMFVPFFTNGLYLSRWVQLSAIPLCGLYGAATYWLPRRYSYPLASVILLLLLIIVR